MNTAQNSPTPTSPSAKKKPSKTLLYVSLVLNGVFIVAVIGLYVFTHTRSYWMAEVVSNVHRNTCPTDIAEKMDSKEEGEVQVQTYYVGSEALASGCADFLIQTAQVDDFRTYPEHAKAAADALRNISPDGRLIVTVVKSADNGEQLSPITFQKKQ